VIETYIFLKKINFFSIKTGRIEKGMIKNISSKDEERNIIVILPLSKQNSNLLLSLLRRNFEKKK
jgi:hypothetical protein